MEWIALRDVCSPGLLCYHVMVLKLGVGKMSGVEGQTRGERITGKHNFTFPSFPLLYEEQFFISITSLTRDLEG
jgi:hypothetical protein